MMPMEIARRQSREKKAKVAIRGNLAANASSSSSGGREYELGGKNMQK
jgi:hypothetical protein